MNRPIVDWQGKRVWLLGASSGIGEALAQALLQRGARVAVSARRTGRLLALAATAPDAAAALVLPCDAVDERNLAQALQTLLGHWGGIDVAIYAAGDYVPTACAGLAATQARSIVDVNLLGAMSFTSLLQPHLALTQGQIAFVASVAGYRGLPNAGAYGPSKAALINYAEALALEAGGTGMGVRLINPGFVATALTAKNRFPMPALISPAQAAEEILKGFAGRAFEIHFPKRFTRAMKLLSLLPAWLYFPLVRRITGSGLRGGRDA